MKSAAATTMALRHPDLAVREGGRLTGVYIETYASSASANSLA
jgi:hypothetical protein